MDALPPECPDSPALIAQLERLWHCRDLGPTPAFTPLLRHKRLCFSACLVSLFLAGLELELEVTAQPTDSNGVGGLGGWLVVDFGVKRAFLQLRVLLLVQGGQAALFLGFALLGYGLEDVVGALVRGKGAKGWKGGRLGESGVGSRGRSGGKKGGAAMGRYLGRQQGRKQT